MLQVERRTSLLLHLTQCCCCCAVVVAVVVEASTSIIVVVEVVVHVVVRGGASPAEVETHLSAQVQHHLRLMLLLLLILLLLTRLLGLLLLLCRSLTVVIMLRCSVVGTWLSQTQVETFIVRTGQIQAIDTAQVQTRVGTRIRRRQTNLLSHKPDVQTFKPTQRVAQGGLKV